MCSAYQSEHYVGSGQGDAGSAFKVLGEERGLAEAGKYDGSEREREKLVGGCGGGRKGNGGEEREMERVVATIRTIVSGSYVKIQCARHLSLSLRFELSLSRR